MLPMRLTVLSCFVGVTLLMAALIGDSAQGVTRLHDPAADHTAVVHGATNGHGANRGPWVVQIAAAKDELLELSVGFAGPSSTPYPILRVIAGNGSVYVADARQCIVGTGPCVVYTCVRVPVTGWVTAHVDPVGDAEQRLEFRYRRSADLCEFEDPPH